LSSDFSKVQSFWRSVCAFIDRHLLHELRSALLVLLALLAALPAAQIARSAPSASNGNRIVRNLHASDAGPQSNTLPEGTVIIVNGRTLAGPNSSAQQRSGRL